MTVVARAVVARATALMIEASPGLEALSSFQMPLPRRGRRCSSASKVGKEMPPSMPWLSTASAGSEAACSTRGERGLMMATRRSVYTRSYEAGVLLAPPQPASSLPPTLYEHLTADKCDHYYDLQPLRRGRRASEPPTRHRPEISPPVVRFHPSFVPRF